MNPSPAMLAIVTDAFGGRGGIAQYNRDFLGALAETGAVSSITVLPRQAPDYPVLPKTIEQTPARPGWIGYSISTLRTALFRPVDLVFCGHLFMAPLAALITRLKGAKLIVQTHGIEAWPRPSRPQRAALEAADLVLCVSRHTRSAVLSWAAIAPERVLVVPDTVREAFTPGDGSQQRAALALEGKRVLLTVGRMDPHERYKGQDRVIAAIPELVAKGHDICYLVIGEGDDRKRLETLARDAGVNERVRFLGRVGLQTLVEIYRMADLFVMPSTGEGFGVTFLEAMASGTPALGLETAGSKDALADGELGTSTSEAELVVAISRLLHQAKPDSFDLARAVRARFGREKFVAAAHQVLNRLTERDSDNPNAVFGEPLISHADRP
ncbi:MAG: glycosyltransferase family 4 protein [Terracidiphilus sp.]|jgi:phosphatidyl-myo-inositol dimannoside synthase